MKLHFAFDAIRLTRSTYACCRKYKIITKYKFLTELVNRILESHFETWFELRIKSSLIFTNYFQIFYLYYFRIMNHFHSISLFSSYIFWTFKQIDLNIIHARLHVKNITLIINSLLLFYFNFLFNAKIK